jgi:hypothetical protein
VLVARMLDSDSVLGMGHAAAVRNVPSLSARSLPPGGAVDEAFTSSDSYRCPVRASRSARRVDDFRAPDGALCGLVRWSLRNLDPARLI